jgi:hypothetical protein
MCHGGSGENNWNYADLTRLVSMHGFNRIPCTKTTTPNVRAMPRQFLPVAGLAMGFMIQSKTMALLALGDWERPARNRWNLLWIHYVDSSPCLSAPGQSRI